MKAGTTGPLVTVVLPTYNRARLLPRSIQSVLGQSYRNLELIVVDDGSTDDTERAVGRIVDSRVRYVRRGNGGAAAARNSGIALARGELVAFQDSDDEWLEGKLEQQVAALAAAGPAAVLCVCSYLLHRDFRVYQLGSAQLRHHNDLRRQTLDNFFFATPTWLVRRDALERAGLFDPALRCWEDWELAIRLADVGDFILLDRPLHLQYFNETGVNGAPTARMASMRRVLQLHSWRWDAHRAALADHHFTVGRLECLHGSITEARRQMREALAIYPRHRKAWLALGLTYTGPTLMAHLIRLRRRARSLRPRRATGETLGPLDLD